MERGSGCEVVDSGPSFEVIRVGPAFRLEEDASNCPCCQADMAAGAVLCLQCGYDAQTGKRPAPAYRTHDEVEEIGSRALGSFTEYIFRRDPNDGLVLIRSGE